MKLLRIWLLVVLAVLLPMRGAMSATMLCVPPGAGSAHETSLAASHADHGDNHGQAHESHEPALHGEGGPAHDHSAADRCNLCSASCSSPPLPSASAGIEEPAILTSVSFPDLCAPAPTFQSGGQERPPRTS